MPFCSQCGTKNADDARFCLSCGAPVSAGPVASSPGQPVQPQVPPPPPAAYPGGQYYQPPQAPPPGAAVPQYQYPQAQVPPVPGQIGPQPYGMPPQVQGPPGYPPGIYPAQAVARRKSPGAAAALGFFLGGFGAQAFYNGQFKKAILQLVVWWIVSIVILSQAFITMTDMFGNDQVVGTNPGVMGMYMLMGLIFAAACAFDGYKVAERVNRGERVSDSVFF